MQERTMRASTSLRRMMMERRPESMLMDFSEYESAMELEDIVLGERAEELKKLGRKQALQKSVLREERKKAREEKEGIALDREMLHIVKRADFISMNHFPGPKVKRARLNVGGQIFEISKKFLEADPKSLLSVICAGDCPMRKDDRIPYLDRDWSIFRQVLKFLRDNTNLPNKDKQMMLALYKESSFLRLDSLKRAIEETHLKLARIQIRVDSDPSSMYYGQLRETTLSNTKPKSWRDALKSKLKKPSSSADWWSSTSDYKGKRFGPISQDPYKVVAANNDRKDSIAPMYASTWSYHHYPSPDEAYYAPPPPSLYYHPRHPHSSSFSS